MDVNSVFLHGLVKQASQDSFEEALESISAEDLEEILTKEAGAVSSALAKGTLLGGAARAAMKNPGVMTGGGAVIGAVQGASSPGYNRETGQPRSALGGALRGATKGALIGGGLHAGSKLGLGYAAAGQKGLEGTASKMWSGAKKTLTDINKKAGKYLER